MITDQQYLQIADEAFDEALEIVRSSNGWKVEIVGKPILSVDGLTNQVLKYIELYLKIITIARIRYNNNSFSKCEEYSCTKSTLCIL